MTSFKSLLIRLFVPFPFIPLPIRYHREMPYFRHIANEHVSTSRWHSDTRTRWASHGYI